MLGVSFVQEFVCVFNSSTTHVLLRGLRLTFRTSYPQCPTGRDTKYRHSNIYSAAVNDPVIISTNNLFANESNLGNIRSLSLYILSWGSSGIINPWKLAKIKQWVITAWRSDMSLSDRSFGWLSFCMTMTMVIDESSVPNCNYQHQYLCVSLIHQRTCIIIMGMTLHAVLHIIYHLLCYKVTGKSQSHYQHNFPPVTCQFNLGLCLWCK